MYAARDICLNVLLFLYRSPYVLLSLLHNIKPSIQETYLNKTYVRNQIIDRFIPGENYESAAIQFKYRITKNSNTYSANVIDFFHKKCKESSSISNSSETVSQLAAQALTATTNLTKTIGSNIKNWFWA